MIQAVIFDLDGTLVDTEKLKAISYARAAVQLCPGRFSEEDVIEGFKEVVGRSRREVSVYLMERFSLQEVAASRMEEFAVNAPWQAFAQVRLQIYEKMLADPEILLHHQWLHNIGLLHQVRGSQLRVGLATMSHCEQAHRVLEVLGLLDAFDFVATRDDVEQPKPDPEIYLLVAHELGISPENCLVIEDSPAGVQAAQAAGMTVVAVTTPFTRAAFRQQDLLDRRWVVDEAEKLAMVVGEHIKAYAT
ncbi:MAG: HAD family hydrolase [Acidiferrobacterales bacterium]